MSPAKQKKPAKAALIEELVTRGISTIYPSRDALEARLKSPKKLRIYWGVDPTGADLHLGHLTKLLVLKRLQELGHEIILLIGDFTAQIGDPTDKLAPRQPLTPADIKKNLRTFKAQASRVLRFSGKNAAKLMFNSKWLGKLSFADVMRLAQHVTVQQLIERDMFQERLKAGKPIGAHEFLYPLMQGYDSVAMKARKLTFPKRTNRHFAIHRGRRGPCRLAALTIGSLSSPPLCLECSRLGK